MTRDAGGKPPEALVSVVVVTLDDVDLTERCVQSLRAQTYSPLELIVVDNGSRPEIAARLEAALPGCRLLRNAVNLGFAGGYNRGMRQARGEYVAVLNNDAVADARWIEELVRTAARDPRAGAVATVVIDGRHPDRLDSCGLGMALDGMSRQIGTGRPVGDRLPELEVLAASGCACLFRREALDRAGLFDESFFAYCEDADLGLRLRWAGYRTVLAPDAKVWHHQSATAGRFSARKVFWVERNHFWVAVKSFPAPLLLLLPAATLWRYGVQAGAVLRARGETAEYLAHVRTRALASATLRALAAAAQGLPEMLRRRRAIMSSASVSPRDVGRAILRHRLSAGEVLRAGRAPARGGTSGGASSHLRTSARGGTCSGGASSGGRPSPGSLARRVLGRHFSVAGRIYRGLFVDLEEVARCLSPHIPAGAVVLDVGGGDGDPLNPLLRVRPDITVRLVDPSPEVGALIRPELRSRVELHPGTSMATLGSASRRDFSVVLVADVLHHIPPESRAAFFADLRALVRDAGGQPRIIVKDVEPGGARATLGRLADRYVSGDRSVAPVGREAVRRLIRDAFGADVASTETGLFAADPPNYALVFTPRARD